MPSICRNQFLLSYFGQLDSPACGRCDVCLSGEALDPRSEKFSVIARAMYALLSTGSLSLEELLSSSEADPEEVTRVVEWLVDQGKVVREKNLMLKWKKGAPEI